MIFTSLFTTSTALACPSGYGLAKQTDSRSMSMAMLDYGVPYSPSYLNKCVQKHGSYGYTCGSLDIDYLVETILEVNTRDPAITVSFVHVTRGYFFADGTLQRFGLPGNFEDPVIRKWCEQTGNKMLCHEETNSTSLFLPRSQEIRKKIFQHITNLETKDCRIISF